MTIVIGCNITIVVKLQQASKKRMTYTSDQNVLNKRFHEQRYMTKILLTVAGTFLVLHLTQVLAKFWEAFYPIREEVFQYSIRNYIYFELFTFLGYMITDFQNSINFFLYCVFGTKVRKVLQNTLSCRKRDNAYSSNYDINTISKNT